MSELDIQPYERDIINTYRGWVEVAKVPTEAIDCDFVELDEDPTAFETIDQVYDSLLKQLEDLPTDAPELVSQRLTGSIAYIEVAHRGIEMGFSEFVLKTMGAEPVFFDVTPDDAEALELDARLREFGMGWDEKFRDPFQEASLAFSDETAGKKLFRRTLHGGFRSLAKYNPDRKKPKVELGLVSVDESGSGATYAEGGAIGIDFNLHPRHHWRNGEVAEAGLHEPVHAVHLDILTEAVENDDMSPALGVTSMVTAEMTHFETLGLAASLAIISRRRDPISEFQTLYSPRAFKVRSNGGHMINNGYSLEEVEKYTRERLPLDPLGDMRQSIETRRDDTHDKAYHSAYMLGMEQVTPFLEMPCARQDRIVRALFTTFKTASEVAAIFGQTQ